MAESDALPFVTFSNGNKFPAIGLGTFAVEEGDCRVVVKEAILSNGYRAIDTASVYENEDKVGQGLKDCFDAGIKREDIYVTSKLWHSEKDDVEGALRRSLAKLQLEYLDLYLVHWMLPHIVWEDPEPIKATPIHKVWAEMERLVDLGLVKNIGVSNCTIPVLLDLLTYARIRPVVNQVELHPYLVQKDLVAFHNRLGVKLQAYSPLSAPYWTHRDKAYEGMNLLKEPVIIELAEKYQKSVGQIILNWHLHRGHMIVPKTSKLNRLSENLKCYNFTLTQEEYDSITALDRHSRAFDPKFIGILGLDNIPYFE